MYELATGCFSMDHPYWMLYYNIGKDNFSLFLTNWVYNFCFFLSFRCCFYPLFLCFLPLVLHPFSVCRVVLLGLVVFVSLYFSFSLQRYRVPRTGEIDWRMLIAVSRSPLNILLLFSACQEHFGISLVCLVKVEPFLVCLYPGLECFLVLVYPFRFLCRYVIWKELGR